MKYLNLLIVTCLFNSIPAMAVWSDNLPVLNECWDELEAELGPGGDISAIELNQWITKCMHRKYYESKIGFSSDKDREERLERVVKYQQSLASNCKGCTVRLIRQVSSLTGACLQSSSNFKDLVRSKLDFEISNAGARSICGSVPQDGITNLKYVIPIDSGVTGEASI
jgi:hypothetical protein